MWQLVRLSGSGMFQVLVGSASWIALVRVLSTFGSDALAGYTISIRVILFTLLPAWGLSNAAATMVGQALGARKPDRAEAAVWMAGRFNLVFLGSVGRALLRSCPLDYRHLQRQPRGARLRASRPSGSSPWVSRCTRWAWC